MRLLPLMGKLCNTLCSLHPVRAGDSRGPDQAEGTDVDQPGLLGLGWTEAVGWGGRAGPSVIHVHQPVLCWGLPCAYSHHPGWEDAQAP